MEHKTLKELEAMESPDLCEYEDWLWKEYMVVKQVVSYRHLTDKALKPEDKLAH